MQLEQSRLWKSEMNANGTLAVAQGTLWLTFESQDIILHAGQQWTAPHPGEVIVQALGGTASFMAVNAPPVRNTNDDRLGCSQKWLAILRIPILRLHL